MDELLSGIQFSPMAVKPTGVRPQGRPKPPIKALMCDVYGTLLISGSGDIGLVGKATDGHHRIDDVLQRHRIDLAADQLIREMREAVARAHRNARRIGIEHPEVVIEHIWKQVLCWDDDQRARRFAIDFECCVNPVWPMPHLHRLIDACRERLSLGIISNAQFYTPMILERLMGERLPRLGIDGELVILSYQFGHAKPGSYLFDVARHRLARKAISPRQVLYVGNDIRNDIAPAAACGFQTALFAGDARSLRWRSDDAESRAMRPDVIVTDLNQLTDFIKP